MIFYDFVAISRRSKNDATEPQNSRLSSSIVVNEGSKI